MSNNSIDPLELLVPSFEIVSNPTVRLSEIRARRFGIVDGPIGLSINISLNEKWLFEEVGEYDPIESRFDILDF